MRSGYRGALLLGEKYVSGPESKSNKDNTPRFPGEGPDPGRAKTAGTGDSQVNFKPYARLSRNGQEIPSYRRRQSASCDRTRRANQIHQGYRRPSLASEPRRRNPEELEVRTGQHGNNC